VRTVKVRRVRLEEGAHRHDVLVGECSAGVEVGAQVAVLLRDPADTDAECQASAAEMVHRGRLLGDEQRIALRKHEHPCRQPDLFGSGGEIAECGE
jgi:hypothetical protein